MFCVSQKVTTFWKNCKGILLAIWIIYTYTKVVLEFYVPKFSITREKIDFIITNSKTTLEAFTCMLSKKQRNLEQF